MNSLEESILSGHRNGRTKAELKIITRLDEEGFYKELNKLREKCIVLIDKTQGTYYKPDSEEEYIEIIQKNLAACNKSSSIIYLASQELKNLKK